MLEGVVKATFILEKERLIFFCKKSAVEITS